MRRKTQAVRRAQVDVFGAVTGNRLVLMTPDEVDAALGTPILGIRTIDAFEQLSDARAEMRRAVAEEMAQIKSFEEFMVGVCEALTNAIKHGGAAVYQVLDRGGVLQVAISDVGPGIDVKTLPSATLEAGFSTKGSLGVGFTIMLEVSDRVLLSTRPSGTTVVLETCR